LEPFLGPSGGREPSGCVRAPHRRSKGGWESAAGVELSRHPVTGGAAHSCARPGRKRFTADRLPGLNFATTAGGRPAAGGWWWPPLCSRQQRRLCQLVSRLPSPADAQETGPAARTKAPGSRRLYRRPAPEGAGAGIAATRAPTALCRLHGGWHPPNNETNVRLSGFQQRRLSSGENALAGGQTTPCN